MCGGHDKEAPFDTDASQVSVGMYAQPGQGVSPRLADYWGTARSNATHMAKFARWREAGAADLEVSLANSVEETQALYVL